ncbi:MAG: HIRAN domain-containing protein [Gammaproteobacteria bacterium]|nr:HIRAN domain-containing protein [Gammaproteobacteria bacterium]
MKRRGFLGRLAGLAGLGFVAPQLPAAANPAVPAASPKRRLILQHSPVAGFRYYNGPFLQADLRIGDELSLCREPGNPHDRRAVSVFLDNWKLGYVPRRHNVAVSQMLDRGETLRAHICGLQQSDNPWKCLFIELWLEV